MLITLRQKNDQLQRYGIRIVSFVPKQIIKKISLLSGSVEDIRRLKTCKNSGATSKTVAIALLKFRRNDGITNCITIPTKTGQGKATASGADSLPMWINLIPCFSTYHRGKLH